MFIFNNNIINKLFSEEIRSPKHCLKLEGEVSVKYKQSKKYEIVFRFGHFVF